MFNYMQCFEYNLMLSYCRSLFSQELASISPLWHFTEHFAFLEIKLFSQNLYLSFKIASQGFTWATPFPLYNRQQLEPLSLRWKIPFLDFRDKCSNMVGKESFLWSLSLAPPWISIICSLLVRSLGLCRTQTDQKPQLVDKKLLITQYCSQAKY